MVRYPIVQGRFYESDFTKLENQITNCFLNSPGPGALPINRRSDQIKFIITPHSPYYNSGYCQAWLYKELAESKLADLYIILGSNHTGYGASYSTYLDEIWQTPFGNIKIDRDSGLKLKENCRFLKNEKISHEYEHSIETQLPFLQFVNRSSLDQLQILPIVISKFTLEECNQLANEILNLKKQVCIIASSELTHYGFDYNYLPFRFNKKQGVYNLDKELIKYILNLDTSGFLEFINKKKLTICCPAAILIAMETAKQLNKKPRLLIYYSRGDITNDFNNNIGYGGIVFE